MELNETDKAYLAGFFDGEGCIGYYNANHDPEGTPYYHASVNISNTDPRIIPWIRSVVGFGGVNTVFRSKDKKRRTAYQWQIGQKVQVREFLETIRPYLKIKGDQVDVLLALFDMEQEYVQRHGSVTADVIGYRQETELKLKALKRVV